MQAATNERTPVPSDARPYFTHALLIATIALAIDVLPYIFGGAQ